MTGCRNEDECTKHIFTRWISPTLLLFCHFKIPVFIGDVLSEVDACEIVKLKPFYCCF